MKIGSTRVMASIAGMLGVCLIGVALAASGNKTEMAVARSTANPGHPPIAPMSGAVLASAMGQAAPRPAGQGGPQEKMAEDVFKNIQVLKGITVDDFMGTMGIMSAALGFCCSNCHTGAGTDSVKWEDDTANKRTARRMVTMVAAINKQNFGGRQVVTCWTCHRGRYFPVTTPDLDTVYGEPKQEPDDLLKAAVGVPTVDQVLNKFVQAIGGAQKLAAVTSYTATGKSLFFGSFGGDARVEVFAKAPDQRATHINFPQDPSRGDSTRTYDGRTGWWATPLAVLRKYELTGGERDGARLDAQLSFPWDIKKYMTNLRVGPPVQIDGKDYDVVQGDGVKGVVGTLYFEAKTGLLERVVRFSPSPIGRVPTQTDFSDYRDVNGVKFPFRSRFSWLDGQDTFEFTDVKFNVPIDAARFGEPTSMGVTK